MATPVDAGDATEKDPSAKNRAVTNAAAAGLELTQTISVAGTTVHVVRSCNSVWLFDPKRSRFRRTPKDMAYDMPAPDGEWEPYSRVTLDDASPRFVVVLNDAGSRLLQSWRHSEPCEHCGAGEDDIDLTVAESADQTTELSLAAIKEAANRSK